MKKGYSKTPERAGTSGQVAEAFEKLDPLSGKDRRRIQNIFKRNPDPFAQLLLLRGLDEGGASQLRGKVRKHLKEFISDQVEQLMTAVDEDRSYIVDIDNLWPGKGPMSMEDLTLLATQDPRPKKLRHR